MIPKILHYVWFGGSELPEPDRTYVAGWAKACPGWEIRRWGLEDTKDVDCTFLRETLAAKKWAFACDLLRLYVLSKVGGFYLDTDVELKSSLEPFRSNELCMGLNMTQYPQTALIGAVPHHPIIEELLAETMKRKFVIGPGVYDETANNTVFRKLFIRRGVNLDKVTQEHDTEVLKGVRFYPSSLLCRVRGDLPNVAEHHLTGSWRDPYRRKSAINLPFSLRLVRMKRRYGVPNKDNKLNLLENEKPLFSFRVRKMTIVLVKRV